jgi:transposase
MTLEMVREVEAEREQELVEKKNDPATDTIRALCRIRGIGKNVATVLTREVFYRSFGNRRQIATYDLGRLSTFRRSVVHRDKSD